MNVCVCSYPEVEEPIIPLSPLRLTWLDGRSNACQSVRFILLGQGSNYERPHFRTRCLSSNLLLLLWCVFFVHSYSLSSSQKQAGREGRDAHIIQLCGSVSPLPQLFASIVCVALLGNEWIWRACTFKPRRTMNPYSIYPFY